MPRRQIRALAKSSMWNNKLLGAVLTGMGQIPIERGSGDTGALDCAIEELRKGACIGIYPEGTRSLGRALRARSGIGYMARAVPETTIIGVACSGTVAIPRFPTARPHVHVDSSSSIDPRSRPTSHRSSTAPGCSPSSAGVHQSRSRAASAPRRCSAAYPPGPRSWRSPASPAARARSRRRSPKPPPSTASFRSAAEHQRVVAVAGAQPRSPTSTYSRSSAPVYS